MALSKVADAATPFCHHNAESQFYGFFKTKEGQTANWEGFLPFQICMYVNSLFWNCGGWMNFPIGFCKSIICSN